jgi:hypothetical protein
MWNGQRVCMPSFYGSEMLAMPDIKVDFPELWSPTRTKDGGAATYLDGQALELS